MREDGRPSSRSEFGLRTVVVAAMIGAAGSIVELSPRPGEAAADQDGRLADDPPGTAAGRVGAGLGAAFGLFPDLVCEPAERPGHESPQGAEYVPFPERDGLGRGHAEDHHEAHGHDHYTEDHTDQLAEHIENGFHLELRGRNGQIV